jgi:demethylmenaquinone methyltransferase/2-methoxy-6-polyprenyl-1,4-benzoquinol methylase
MAREKDPQLERVHRFFKGTGPSYDFMVNVATLGIDRLWKRKILDRLPPNPQRVLDLACGTGISTIVIADRFPDCHVVGVELREEYLEIAKRKVQEKAIQNIELVLSRAEDYTADLPFDCITSSYLAKYADLSSLTRSSRQMLKEGGILIMHDFTFPPKPYLVWVWRFYFWLLQNVGTPFFPAWKEIYNGLPRLIEETRWIHELTDALETNQFQNITMEYLTVYGSAIVSARK